MDHLGLSRRKRSLQVFMNDEDILAFTEILRQAVSPLEMLEVDFRRGRIRRLDSLLAGKSWNLFITSPLDGEPSLADLQDVLQYTDELTEEPFLSVMPRRQARFIPMRGIRRTSPAREGGAPIEVHNEGVFHFVYERDDAIAHAFTEKILRLLKKFLVSQFAIVNAATGEVIKEVRGGSSRWIGPHVIESCRLHPNRYICFAYSGIPGATHCLAPGALD